MALRKPLTLSEAANPVHRFPYEAPLPTQPMQGPPCASCALLPRTTQTTPQGCGAGMARGVPELTLFARGSILSISRTVEAPHPWSGEYQATYCATSLEQPSTKSTARRLIPSLCGSPGAPKTQDGPVESKSR